MAATQSSSSSSGQKDAAGPSGSGGGGIRNHLRNILPIPKHATFHVRLTVHQLSALPVASGFFAVQWKFKNIAGDAVPKRQRTRLPGRKRNKDALTPTAASFPQGVQDVGNGNGSTGKGKERARDETPEIPPSSSVESSNPSENMPANDASANVEYTADSRGSTSFVALRDYNVLWDHTVDTAVDMHIERETGDLQTNQLILTIVQQSTPGEPKPKTPVGTVLLNLAEYADAGVVTRKHLLRGTKTNATLKVTLQVEYIGGEKQYRPPPLRKSEILAGISGLLSTMLSEFEELQVPGGTSAAFSGEGIIPYAEDWTFHPLRPPLDRNKNSSYNTSPTPSAIRSAGGSAIFHENTIHGADTERVIECIFNPYPSTSVAPSPFTYFAPNKVPTIRPRTAPSLSKDLLAVPGQGDRPLAKAAAGTQEHLQAVQANGQTTTAPSSWPQGLSDARKLSLDLDSSARSVAFSVAPSDAGDGSVDSHQSHNSEQSHMSGKKAGWLKRLLSPNSSRATSKESVAAVATTNGDGKHDVADDTQPGNMARARSRTPDLFGRSRSRTPDGYGRSQQRPRLSDPPEHSNHSTLKGLGFDDLNKRMPPLPNGEATVRASRPRHSMDK